MLNRLRSIALLVLMALVLALGIPTMALADTAQDAQLFQGNCSVCHALGTNRVIAMKNLQKQTLEKYDM
ncbi:MAG: hypothetical protein AAFX01_04910 [Cyanobacteria bacterium J06638_28]